MSHVPEEPTRYVCENCQVVHAGTPDHVSGGDYEFDPPESCGACGETAFVEINSWIHHRT